MSNWADKMNAFSTLLKMKDSYELNLFLIFIDFNLHTLPCKKGTLLSTNYQHSLCDFRSNYNLNNIIVMIRYMIDRRCKNFFKHVFNQIMPNKYL